MRSLITFLKQRGLPLDDQELADILWLAPLLDQPSEQVPVNEHGDPKGASIAHRPISTTGSTEAISIGAEQSTEDDSLNIALPPDQTGEAKIAPDIQSGVQIQTPTAPALRQSLEIGRALRPMMRTVNSRTQQVLDEEATAIQIAEHRLIAGCQTWFPIFRAAPERQFDIDVLIEDSASSMIWQDVLIDFEKVLRWQGAFRNVRTWSLAFGSDGEPQLFIRQGRVTHKYRRTSAKELCDPTGRRLILVVSDCVSVGWYQRPIYELMHDWAREGPVSLLQCLPQGFWEDSGLGAASVPIHIRSKTVVSGRSRLIAADAAAWDFDSAREWILPMVTLNPYTMQQWARVMMGMTQAHVPGRLIDVNALGSPLTKGEAEPPNVSPLELAQLFWNTASGPAKQLAGYLATVPISMPVVYLIQQTLMQEALPVHVAEVFMSGLIRRVSPQTANEHCAAIQYDFIASEVRDALVDNMPHSQVDAVLTKVSEFIARKAGLSLRSFPALLTYVAQNPIEDQPALLPFAQIAKRVLRRIGGEYAALVDRIEQLPPSPAIPPSVEPQEFVGYPPLEEFVYQTPMLVFGALISEEKKVRVATISVKTPELVGPHLELLEFEIVSLIEATKAVHRPQHENRFFHPDRFAEGTLDPISVYANYAELSRNEQEGEDYQIRMRDPESLTAIFAAHGGKTEPGTSEIADAVAGQELGFYAFEGLKRSANQALSLRGSHFDEPSALRLARKVDHSLEIHGAVGAGRLVYVGGRDQAWINRLEASFQQAGFNTERMTRGQQDDQLCNLNVSKQGAYLELTQGLRQEIFDSLDSASAEESLFERFVQAIRATIPELQGKWRLQTRKGRAECLRESLGNGVELEMIVIPEGDFLMGALDTEDERGQGNERPQHLVQLPGFMMGRFPITQAQWRQVAALPEIERPLDINPSRFTGDYRPVERVTWYDAVEFCARLSQYTQREYRLPSEAEWEYACRGGTQTAFSFGDMITTQVANYNGSSYGDGPGESARGETRSVTEQGYANPFGLSDMHGNVFEWCLDYWHKNYEAAPKDGSAWLTNGVDSLRVLRGGSWGSYPVWCRSASRVRDDPGLDLNGIGFRVVSALREAP